MIEQFHRPQTVREALGLKRRFKDQAVFLAGGTYLNSNACTLCPERRRSLAGLGLDHVERKQAMRPLCTSNCALRPGHFISLAGLGLDRVERTQRAVSIGALCTLQRLIEDHKVPAALKAALGQVVSRNIREAATLGGHIAANPPYSDVLPMLVALQARVGVSRHGGVRTILVADQIREPAAELITKVVIPRPRQGRTAACRNARASANALSVVSAAVSLAVARGAVREPIIALGGVASRVVRLTAIEDALDGKPLPALDELQALVSRAVRPTADLTGSAAFRRHQAGVVVALALRDAAGQKRGRS